MDFTKTQFVDHLIVLQQQNKEELNRHFRDLQEALQQEQKSTAGDKHDTGRAMIHLEQEKMSRQLNELKKTIQQLHQLKQNQSTPEIIGFGSLIQTADHYILLGIGLGKVIFEKHTILCVSMDAPLAQQVLGKSVRETFMLAGKSTAILSVL